MKLKNIISYNLILPIIWISFFGSLNINPTQFFELNYLEKIRLLIPFFLFSFFIIVKFKNNLNNSLNNLVYFLFFIIFILYLYFNLNNQDNHNSNIFWPVYMFISLFTLIFLSNYQEKKLLLTLSILFIFIIYFLFFYQIIQTMFTNDIIHFYGIMGSSLTYGIFENPPRSSGMSRFSLVLFFCLIISFLQNEKFEKLKLIAILFFATNVLLYNSRTMSFIFIFMNLLVFIIYNKKLLTKKKLVLYSLLLPILINFSYNLLLNNFEKSKEYLNHNGYLKVLSSSIIRDQKDYHQSLSNLEKLDRYTSGRFQNWRLAVNIISKNPIIGYGAQSDRIYVKQSIHNSLLYTILSGGLISGICLILIYLYTIYLLLNFYFFNFRKFNGMTETHISAGILIIIILRSILETSFAIFSIDYLLFIISFVILNYSSSKNKIEKIK